ncbi:MAG TPA: hypothetical protein VF338_07025 [Leptolinea sp.]
MGPGHLGVALAAKPLAKSIPLWILLIASEGIDILFFAFTLLGIEKQAVSISSIEKGIEILVPGVIQWSHGLFMAILWSLLAALATFLVMRQEKLALVVGLVFFSHWVLDFVVHNPDLPVFFEGSPTLGLGLWGSGPGMIFSGILELVLLGGGLFIYFRWRRNQAK